MASRTGNRELGTLNYDVPVTISGIAHVQVSITPGGEDAARAFYGGLLALPEIPKPESLADRGGCWFA